MKPIRLMRTFELLESYKAFNDVSLLLAPRFATDQELRTFHTHDYIDVVKSFGSGEVKEDTSRFNFSLTGDNPIYRDMYSAATLSTGGSLVAAEAVVKGDAGVAFNIAGGLHHAGADHASGFCVFNDPVIMINSLLQQGLRVAYVDIDAHHGDGVQNAFYDTSRVLTISTHESGKFLFPGTGFVDETGYGDGKGFAANIPLLPYTGDATYLWVFEELVVPLIQSFRPDILVTQLGIDTHYKDPITHLRLTSRAFGGAVSKFAGMGIPWVALGGGGYDLEAVARCWTIAYGIMCGQKWSDNIPTDYAVRYNSWNLHDENLRTLEGNMESQIDQYARKTVEDVKRLIFPRHRIT